ncbi:hypothetical protein [Roseomonas chloroacetimidivorans]|uniref:hypothetical protein n=1 Tax=Roseomonas chloroacetimidivorans TaxID=1766656 RepID=UPI003C7305AD
MKKDFAWANLVYADVALAMCLAHQMRHSAKPLLFVVAGPLAPEQIHALRLFSKEMVKTRPVEMKNPHVAAFRYRLTMTKLRMWELEDFEQVCVLDSDLLILGNPDDIPLLGSEQCLAAVEAQDGRWNSGVMIIRPDRRVAADMLKRYAASHQGFKLPDQQFLNRFWIGRPGVANLPRQYNARTTADAPDAVFYHFAGMKPWVLEHRPKLGDLARRWDIVVTEVRDILSNAGMDADSLLDSIRVRPLDYFMEQQRQWLSGPALP